MLYLYLQFLVLIIMSLILVFLPNDKLLCKYQYKLNIIESFCTHSIFKKNGVSRPHFYLLKIHVTSSVMKLLVGNDVRANV